MPQKYQVKYYFNPNGSSPVKEFIGTLDSNTKSRIIRIFQIMENFGIYLVKNKIKKLSGTPLWEIKVLGKQSIRLFYFIKAKNNIIILHGFIKKKQKTPLKEIGTAFKRYQILIEF